MKLKRDFLRSCLLASTTAGVLILACGGDSGTRFDPQRADELTQAALISGTDLPGSGWRIRDDDVFQDAAPDQAADAACHDLRNVLTEAREGVAAHAQRVLERPTFTTLIGVVVMVEVTAYDDSDGLAKLVRRYRKLASDGSLAECASKLSERTLSVRPRKASASSPHGGVVFADTRRFTALSGPPLTRVDERYLWVDGNVMVLVTISAPEQRFTSDVVKAALEGTDAAVTRAGKAK